MKRPVFCLRKILYPKPPSFFNYQSMFSTKPKKYRENQRKYLLKSPGIEIFLFLNDKTVSHTGFGIEFFAAAQNPLERADYGACFQI